MSWTQWPRNRSLSNRRFQFRRDPSAPSNDLEKFFVKTREHSGNRLRSSVRARACVCVCVCVCVKEREKERERLRRGHRKRISRRAASRMLSKNFLDKKLDVEACKMKDCKIRAENVHDCCNFNPPPSLFYIDSKTICRICNKFPISTMHR